MDIFFSEARHRIDAMMDWEGFLPILKRCLKRSGLGRACYNPVVLFKCILLGQWHDGKSPCYARQQG